MVTASLHMLSTNSDWLLVSRFFFGASKVFVGINIAIKTAHAKSLYFPSCHPLIILPFSILYLASRQSAGTAILRATNWSDPL